MSGYAGGSTDGTELAAHSYLQKPFSTTVIRTKVREVLDA